ncbi:MAG TPA: SLOG family protein, partial [Allocoleopsis sp.]
MKNIAFITGHRQINNEVVLKGIKLLMNRINNVEYYLCGMALGSDQIFAEYLISQNLSWSAILPCSNQHDKWSISQQKHYLYLLKFAHNIITLSEQYSQEVMHLRNDYMINHSNICLAIYDNRNHGGTANTVKKAMNKGLRTIIFNPQT